MTTIPLAEARANLSGLIEEAISTHQRIEVTKNGRRAVVILSADDYDSLLETLDILSDRDLVADIRRAQDEAERGEVFNEAEVAEAMREAGRLPR
jgi:antitoxin YefM